MKSVPTARLTPLVKDWLLRHRMRHTSNAVETLALSAGVSTHAVNRIRETKSEWTMFETADKILAVIGPHLWHSELGDLFEEAA